MTELSKPMRITLSAQILRQMEQCILSGSWQTGQKIPGEMELMSQFGVSRNTVREAIQSLVYAGILQTRPGDGTYVLCRNRFDAALQSRLHAANLDEILETRLVLETDIVRFAALRRTPAELEALHQALADRDQPDLEKHQFILADSAFHLKVAELCHNTLLYDMYRSMLVFLERLVEAYLFTSGFDRQLEEHSALYQAIVDRDAMQAMEIVRMLVASEQRTFHQADAKIAAKTKKVYSENSLNQTI